MSLAEDLNLKPVVWGEHFSQRKKPAPSDRTAQPMKRKKPLKRESAKHKARRLEVTPFRKEYLANHTKCAVFRHLPSIEIHEITAGANRDAALDQPAAVLAVSREGHEKIQGEPLAKQLARKLVVTPMEFDLAKVNELLAEKDTKVVPQRFDLTDVVPWLDVALYPSEKG
jgi:hypothetical protein